jgi:hypothetical protein
MKEERISSVNAFVDRITKLRSEIPAGNAEQWFFRGQKCSLWGVQPNIFRSNGLSQEHAIIECAQRQNPLEFRDCVSNFEILTKLQHYGLGTRLLDVTLNPLVALFFATEQSVSYTKNANGQYSYQEHDGKVLYRFVNGCALRDLQIRVALEIPFVEFGKGLSLEAFCLQLRDTKAISNGEYESLIADNYEKAINVIQTNSFIVATNSNARLIQQRGAFLLSTAVNVKSNTDVKTSALSKARLDLDKEFEGYFIIPAKDKEEIRTELDFFNVNEATLFPELEHQMRYIQTQATVTVGTIEEYSQYVRKTARLSTASKNLNKSEVETIVKALLSELDKRISDDVVGAIIEQQELDWQNKDSVISRIRRTINKILSNSFSAVEAKNKASAIVDNLLEVQ